MKVQSYLAVVFLLLGCSCAENSAPVSISDGFKLRNFQVDGRIQEVGAMLLANAITGDLTKDKSIITAIVDEYTDKLFNNVHNFAIKTGLDPTPLQNISQKFLTERVTLNHGFLHGISTLQRLKTAKLEYSHDKRVLTVQFPIVFSNLSFTYDYELTFVLIKHTGGMTGKIKNFTMDLVLQFDFKTYHAALLKASVLRTGSITLTFQKNIVDIVLNIMSNFVTLILKPILVVAIQGIVAVVAGKLVTVTNQVIDHLIHPNATQVAYAASTLLH
ncbi:unnamed protein product [Acanthoscelides obtectus]|uniref:Uncharacterized protein n=1 Tax=Acanthoscelides obtectus TaxID=200917 RepID=A0A9P0PW15_ACAOB|nr:unnamed protein product [Acanthoscelides obtectus]CAK1629916.1 hypothetical protein AOBTE_LOCUS6038 [Acanthoscelides obtectus]